MESEWRELPASEFCASVRDGTHDSPNEVIEGKLLVTSRHITGNRLDLSSAYRISVADYEEINRRSKVDQWDVLFTMIGTVGEPCLVSEEPNFAIKNIGLFKNTSETRGKFLYYYLCSPEAQHHTKSHSRGTTQQYIPLGELRKFPVRFPSDEGEMEAIAHILGSLDDKIELNRRMNATLEGMAQALFKSWFVDFDPVIDNALAGGNPIPEELADRAEVRRQALADGTANREAAKHFPAAFQQTESMGWIPEGWEVKQLGELCTQAIGGQWGEDTPHEGLVPAICLRGCDMADISLSGFGEKCPVRFIKPDALKKRTINSNELLIAGSGAGPCGRPMWCSPSLSVERYGHQVIYSNFVKKFTFQTARDAVYAEGVLMPMYENGAIGDYINGTSVPNLDANGLLSGLSIAMPSPEILDTYFKFYTSIDQQKNNDESRSLAKLRDTLLPKLITGELRIPDAEKLTEEALV